jgi:acyl-lipid omega-6 desaturase (Delta-12 desaturase)
MKKQDWLALKDQIEPGQSRWPTVTVIVFDCLVSAIAWRLIHGGTFIGEILSVPLLALVFLHAYLLLHEATHSAISRNKRINALVGHACGWLILMPFLSRQRSHLLHHAWTGHPEGDPANRRIIRRFSVLTGDQAERLERTWRSWLPMLTLNDRIGMWRDPFMQFESGSTLSRIRSEMRAAKTYLGLYVLALVLLTWSGHLGTVLICYVVAWSIQLVLEELVNLPHHAETPLLNASDNALPLWEQDLVSTSIYTRPTIFFLDCLGAACLWCIVSCLKSCLGFESNKRHATSSLGHCAIESARYSKSWDTTSTRSRAPRYGYN